MQTHSTPCPDVGQWRTWLDGWSEDSPLPDGQRHLEACTTCSERVARLRANAAFAAAALATLTPVPERPPAVVDVALARRRLAATPSAVASPPADEAPVRLAAPSAGSRATRVAARWRLALGSAAAVLIVGLALATPQGRAVAADFLGLFRGERFTAVTVDPQQAQEALLALGRLGTVSSDAGRARQTEHVESVAEASRRVGFSVLVPDPAALPAGFAAQPRIVVTPASELRFTFDRARADAYYRSIGRTDVRLPARFDGASLVVTLPPAVLLSYGASPAAPSGTTATTAQSPLGLIVGQSTPVTVRAEGAVSLDEMRQFLLGLPDIPPATRQQLQRIDAWQTTLPIPVPLGLASSQPAVLGSGPTRGSGLVLSESSGLGSAAIWQAGGRVYGLAGTLRAAELQRVASSLR